METYPNLNKIMSEERQQLAKLKLELDELQSKINDLQNKRDFLANKIEDIRFEIKLKSYERIFQPMAIGSIELT